MLMLINTATPLELVLMNSLEDGCWKMLKKQLTIFFIEKFNKTDFICAKSMLMKVQSSLRLITSEKNIQIVPPLFNLKVDAPVITQLLLHQLLLIDFV
jgi:hypothetical protein